MTAPPPCCWRAAGRAGPSPAGRATTGGVGGAMVLVWTRVGLWLGVQLRRPACCWWPAPRPLGQALDDAAGWWKVYPALVDLGPLGVISLLLRREGAATGWLLGHRPPPGRGVGASGVAAASVPAVAFSGGHTPPSRPGAIAPMFALVDLPPWASVVSVPVVPLVAEVAQRVAYLGIVLPRLERRLGRPWLAATIVSRCGRPEHALYPLVVNGGGLDWSSPPTGWGRCSLSGHLDRAYTPWGGGCGRPGPPGGCSTPAPRPPLPIALGAGRETVAVPTVVRAATPPWPPDRRPERPRSPWSPGELGGADERVVAVFLQWPDLRRVLVPMPFLSATTVGGDERGP